MLGPPVSATIAIATTATAVDTKTTATTATTIACKKQQLLVLQMFLLWTEPFIDGVKLSNLPTGPLSYTRDSILERLQKKDWLKKNKGKQKGVHNSQPHTSEFLGPQQKCTSDFSHHQLSLFLPPAGQNASKLSSIINCLA